MEPQSTTIREIDELHQRAHASVQDAVDCARQIGERLLAQKAAMKHGEFLDWIVAHCPFSPRQAQRFMAFSLGTLTSPRDVFQNDRPSHLSPPKPIRSQGIWKDDRWEPEPKFAYFIENALGIYWVAPAPNGATHVSRIYSGDRASAAGFTWRYTIFGDLVASETEFNRYMGTRFPPHSRTGIADILKSYGLEDLRSQLIRSVWYGDMFLHRPVGEPPPEDWYWLGPEPDDGLYQAVKKAGHVNQAGVPTIC